MSEIIKLVIIPLIVWATSQSVKFIIAAIKMKSLPRDKIFWIYQWAGGAPSTHAAMLTSALYLLGMYNGLNAVFGFAFVVSLILMYDLVAERRKQEMLEQHLINSKDKSLLKIVKDGYMLDISGHNFIEIAVGILFGIASTMILAKII